MLSKSEIMRQAWAEFRQSPSWWQVGDLRAKTFAAALRKAWVWAKFNAECARKDAERKTQETIRDAALTDARSDAQARAIQSAIDGLQFKSFRYDISAERRVLEARLAELAA